MPQMNKGGKFIFGKSLIRADLTIHLPAQALAEYNATSEGKVYLFTGSKVTGGFCVTRKGLLGQYFREWRHLTYGAFGLNQQILDFLHLKILNKLSL